MGTILVYIVLIAFWLENALNLELEKLFGMSMGLSFKNISFFFLGLGWLFAVKSQKSLYNRNSINIYLILLGFFILISGFIEVLTIENFSSTQQLIVLKYLIVRLKNFINPWIYFILLLHILQSEKECRHAILGLMILVFVTAGAVAVDQHTAIKLGTSIDFYSYEGRSAGFADTNEYAAYLVLMLPIIVYYALFRKQIANKVAYIIILFIAFMGLVSTVSRGGYIGFSFAACAFFIIAGRQRQINFTRTLAVLIIVIPLVGMFTYVAVPSSLKKSFHKKVIEQADPKTHNLNPWRPKDLSYLEIYTSGRVSKWTKAFELFLESPIWGHGNYSTNEVLKIVPHNDYLNILVKYGLIGFFFYLMIYITIFRKLCFYMKNTNDDDSKMIYIGYLSGFIGYMVCMFGVGLAVPRYIFWVYTAVILKYAQLDTSLSPESVSENQAQ
jgi:O-antigen ligase